MSDYRKNPIKKNRGILNSEDRWSEKIGKPPGYLFPEETDREQPVHYEVFYYSQGEYREEQGEGIPDFTNFLSEENNTWLNIVGVEHSGLLKKLGQEFDVHPVVLEDIQNTVQRPKFEDYGNLLFFALRMLQWDDGESELNSEQLSILMGPSFVISFQERPGDVFDSIRDRLRRKKGRIREAGTDYLAYALLDMVVDTYFLILERLEDEMEDVEEMILSGHRERVIQDMQQIRKIIITVRRSVWPLRDMIAQLQKADFPRIGETTQVYFRDLHDHILRIIDTLEMMKDTGNTLMESYQTSISNDMNSVMKVLTFIATIFIPLTFIAGVYGMNFRYMPELDKAWAYPAVLAVMGAIALVMLIFFKLKKWL